MDDDVFFLATEQNMRFMSELRKATDKPHNVMIAGGGRVGSALAKKLETIYNLKLIEKDKHVARIASQNLSSTVVLNNDIADESLLNNENISEVDYFCAVTNNDQMNILSAKLAKDMGAKKTIAIVNTISLPRHCASIRMPFASTDQEQAHKSRDGIRTQTQGFPSGACTHR